MFGALKKLLGREVSGVKTIGHDIAHPMETLARLINPRTSSPFTGMPDYTPPQAQGPTVNLGLIQPGQKTIPSFNYSGVPFQETNAPIGAPVQLSPQGLLPHDPSSSYYSPIKLRPIQPQFDYLQKLLGGQ